MIDSRVVAFAGLLIFAAACSGGSGGGGSAPADTPVAATSTVAPASTAATPTPAPARPTMQVYDLPAGSGPHDVAPAADGSGIWYTAQRAGKLGLLDPATGAVREVPLGAGSAPHGVIVAENGVAWVTDGGQNAIVSVDAGTFAVTVYPLPADRPAANLNTAAFDRRGTLWFTGQSGVYGRLDTATGEMEVFDAPRGRGPYGITEAAGVIYYASLAGSYLGQVDIETGSVTPLDPPTAGAGVRRAWGDSVGRVWISEWDAGQVAVYDPADGSWREWKLPGDGAMAYAVYVDTADRVWLSDFGSNALVRFDPVEEHFEAFPLPDSPGNVRQMHGRLGETWAPESAADKIVVIRW